MDKMIHAANIAGVESLMNPSTDEGYLCCSSVNCESFLSRHILFTVEGEILRQYSGDVGWEGGSPSNTPWDEIHVEGGSFKVVGIDERTDEYYGQLAAHIIYDVLEISGIEIPEKFKNYEWIMELSDTEYDNLREEYEF